MIKANELRLGNWYEWHKYASMGMGYSQIINGADIDMYCSLRNPIPLTPEILMSCGFEDWSGDQVYAKLGIQIYNPTNFNLIFAWQIKKEQFEYVSLGGENDMDMNIKYLHQLQNLYFALTGEELEISL